MNYRQTLEFSAWLLAAGVFLPGEKIAVLQDEAEETTKSGLIYIPDTEKIKPKRGTIVAIGKGVDPEYPVAIGDRVLFNRFNVLKLSVPNKDGNAVEMLVFHPTDIYLVSRDPERL